MIQNEKIIPIVSMKQLNTYSLQSANVFLHCMRRKEYLKSILLNHAFIPRYNVEDISYLNLRDYKKIGIPMVCFCDIFLNRLRPHMRNYGRYGIGLKKNCMIRDSLNPIFYINSESFFSHELANVIQMALNQLESPNADSCYENILDYQIYQLLYMKPLSGKMFLHNKLKNMNFHDEHEWRYIPNMKYTNLLPFILDNDILSDRNRLNFYNDAIASYKEGWCQFSYDDIKYIIVDKEENRKEFINFIANKLNVDKNKKYHMLSKIITYGELEGDF